MNRTIINKIILISYTLKRNKYFKNKLNFEMLLTKFNILRKLFETKILFYIKSHDKKSMRHTFFEDPTNNLITDVI